MVAFQNRSERKNAMDWVKGVIAGLILLLGFLPSTARIQVVGKAVRVDGAQPVLASTVVNAGRADAANSVAAATPAASSPFPATYFSKEKVAALYANGGELLGWKDGENKYRVRVSVGHKEREFAMSHAFSHIYYILEGSATFVTDGKIIDPKTVKPISPAPGEEIRGTSMEGGESHHLSKGDVVVVPQGVTHWWKEVEPGPFVYFVVQVR
jgi:mannose-6-phosphate isomerase-like protein (cupin superfamily)